MLSRTADSLFWLSRYVERAENTARIIDAATRLSALPASYGTTTNEWQSAVAATGMLPLFKETHGEATAETVIHFLGFSAENPSSIRNCLETARFNARSVRTALTAEMWEVINSAWLELKKYGSGSKLTRTQLADFLAWVKRISLAFDGSAYRTMLRNDAYAFSRLGAFIERADATARILDVKYHVLLPPGAQVGGSLDYFQWTSILRSVSAHTAYHWVYRESIKPWLVADLMILNPEMPRSLTSCYENVTRFLEQLGRIYGRQGAAQRLARTTYAGLQSAHIDDIFGTGLHEYLSDFIGRNDRLGIAISEQYLV